MLFFLLKRVCVLTNDNNKVFKQFEIKFLLPPVVEEKEGESQQVKGNNSDKVEANINVGPGEVLHHIGVVLSVALADTVVKMV